VTPLRPTLRATTPSVERPDPSRPAAIRMERLLAAFDAHLRGANCFAHQLAADEDLLQLGKRLGLTMRLGATGWSSEVFAGGYLYDRRKWSLAYAPSWMIVLGLSPAVVLPGQVQRIRRERRPNLRRAAGVLVLTSAGWDGLHLCACRPAE
jgi:hypothetical protein